MIAATRSGRDGGVRIGGVSFSRFFCVLDMPGGVEGEYTKRRRLGCSIFANDGGGGLTPYFASVLPLRRRLKGELRAKEQ